MISSSGVNLHEDSDACGTEGVNGDGPGRPCDADPGAGIKCATQKAKDERYRRQDMRYRGWRRIIIRNFTPSCFPIIMGTGIVSIILHNLPYNDVWLYWISVAVFALNVFLFIVFFVISLLRYVVYPQIWFAMIRHPTQSLFLGTFPMGLATIINMIVFVCVPAWGPWAVNLAWALWWFDAVVSIMTCYYLPYAIMYIHETSLSVMTAAWLLPVIAPIVAAASGGIVANVLSNPQYALWTMTISYIIWGSGISLAMVVLVIYFQRLTVHRLPQQEVIVSVFLPLGPLGHGGFRIMQLGAVALKIFPKTHALDAVTINAGEVLYVIGWLIAILLWGFGLVWLFFALASISHSKFPFNIGWWGFTFPLGAFIVSTKRLERRCSRHSSEFLAWQVILQLWIPNCLLTPISSWVAGILRLGHTTLDCGRCRDY